MPMQSINQRELVDVSGGIVPLVAYVAYGLYVTSTALAVAYVLKKNS